MFGYGRRAVVYTPSQGERFRLPNENEAMPGNLMFVYNTYQTYGFGPNNQTIRYDVYGELTKRRASYDWLCECPAAYGRSATNDVSSACRRTIQDNSNVVPYRAGNNRITIASVVPPKRLDDRTFHIPGFGAAHAQTPHRTVEHKIIQAG